MPPWRLKPDKDWLSHPLFILLLTFIFSAFLVPYLTGIWQVNERELDVKFGLAGDISDTVSSYMMKPAKYTYLDSNSSRFPTESILKDKIEGDEQCLPIEQRLLLYFPENNRLSEQWSDICASLSFYYIYGVLYALDGTDRPGLSNFSRGLIELAKDRLDLSLQKLN